MRSLLIKENEAGQRLDKFLAKYLKKAPKSFFYKMMRKKNITLNGKKAAGSEKLTAGDEIRLFLSEETIAAFSEQPRIPAVKAKLSIIYENSHILILNKPAGMLSQKAKPDDISLVEHLTAYLLETGQLQREDLAGFMPGICNRLDRNTSGLIVAGKSLPGLQAANALFRTRELHKYYRCIVAGTITDKQYIKGYLKKDEKRNQVLISQEALPEALPIETEYVPLKRLTIGGRSYTYLEVQLLTGRSHQIRAHLASSGHPLVGDRKYGHPLINAYFEQNYSIKHQLLHAYRLEFPPLEGTLQELSEREFTAPLPEIFKIFV